MYAWISSNSAHTSLQRHIFKVTFICNSRWKNNKVQERAYPPVQCHLVVNGEIVCTIGSECSIVHKPHSELLTWGWKKKKDTLLQLELFVYSSLFTSLAFYFLPQNTACHYTQNHFHHSRHNASVEVWFSLVEMCILCKNSHHSLGHG